MTKIVFYSEFTSFYLTIVFLLSYRNVISNQVINIEFIAYNSENLS
jgi:hypothetical protein